MHPQQPTDNGQGAGHEHNLKLLRLCDLVVKEIFHLESPAESDVVQHLSRDLRTMFRTASSQRRGSNIDHAQYRFVGTSGVRLHAPFAY